MSVNSGTLLGSNSDHAASASTRRMNRSGIQLARLRLWVRRASSPVLSRSSRNSCTSACHGSRYTQAAPLRLPPWLTAATEESSVFGHGTRTEEHTSELQSLM